MKEKEPAGLTQALQRKLDTAARHLHDACSSGGQFDPNLLDVHQNAGYELALCAADISAAMALSEHARVAGDSRCVELARVYQAEVAQSIWQRLLGQGPAFGLERSELLEMAQDSAFREAQECSTGEAWSAAGRALIDSGNGRYATGLDVETEQIRESFLRFSDDNVAPVARDIHRKDLDIPDALIEAVAGLGCFGTCIPERYGGSMPDQNADSLGMIVVTEELSRGSLGAAGSLVTRPEIAARALLAEGSEEQRTHWLPRLASGEVLAAIAITEPDVGSDVAGVSLKAHSDGDFWVLNGAKTWCTFAGKANLLVVLARTGPGKGHKGLSLFLVKKPGVAGHEFQIEQEGGGRLAGRAIATLGYRGMHSYDLNFDDFRIPASALVGDEAGQGRGFYAAMAGFAGGRIQTAARATGLMQAAVESAIAQVGQRRVFGQSLGDYPLSQIKLGRMAARLHASRQFAYRVAGQMSAGAGQMEASLVKLYSCRAAEWVCREAMQLHGGMGYAEESDVSRYYVDARVLSIFEGAEETLALKVVARELLARAGRAS